MRKIVISMGVVIGSIAVLFLLLHTRPVRTQVLKFLQSYLEKKQGLKLTARSLDYNLLSLRFKLESLSLSSLEKSEMPAFLEAEEISLYFPKGFFFKKGVHLSNLIIHRPSLYVIIGQNRESNILFSSKSKTSQPGRGLAGFRLKAADIEDAQIRYINEVNQMDFELTGVEVAVRWVAGSEHFFQVHTKKGGHVQYEAIQYDLNTLSVQGRVDESDADFERIELDVSHSRLELRGRLSDFTHPTVDGKIQGELSLEDLHWILPPDWAGSGMVYVQSNVEGPLKQPAVRASLKGSFLSLGNFDNFSLALNAAWEKNRLSVPRFYCSVADGRLEGKAILHPFNWERGNQIELEWDPVGLDSLGFVSPYFGMVSSKASGSLRASWSDFHMDAVEGWAEIHVSPQNKTKTAQEKIPVSGRIRGDIRRGRVVLSAEEFLIPGAQGEGFVQIEQGTLQGEWRIESRELKTSLSSLSHLIGVPDQRTLFLSDVDGNLKISSDLEGTLRSPVLRSEFTGEKISFRGLNDLTIEGKVIYRPSVIEMESILIHPEHGQVNLSGFYPLASSRVLDVQISGKRLSLEKILNLSGQDFSATASVDFSASVFGSPKNPQVVARGVFSDFKYGNLAIGDLLFQTRKNGGKLEFGLSAPSFQSRADGFLLLYSPFRLVAEVGVEDLELQRLNELYPVNLKTNLGGECRAQFKLAVNLARPAETWNIQARVERFFLESGLFQIQNERPIAFGIDSKGLNVEDLWIKGRGANLEGKGSFSWKDKGQSDFFVKADVDLSSLSSLFQEFSAEGRLEINSHLGGLFQRSDNTSYVTLSNGKFEHIRFPEVFEDIRLDIEVKHNQIDIGLCNFELGGAEFSLRGRLPFQSLPVSLPILSKTQEAEHMELQLGVTHFQLSLLNAFTAKDIIQNVGGKIDAEIFIRGEKLQLSQLFVSMITKSFILDISGIQMVQERPVEVYLERGSLRFSPFSISGSNNRVQLGGSIDLMDSYKLDINVEGKLDLSFVQGLIKDIQSHGQCEFDLRVTGSPAVSHLEGLLAIQDGEVVVRTPRIFLESLGGRIQFDRDRLILQDFQGLLNGGEMSAGGEIRLDGWSLSGGEITFRTENAMLEISRSLRSQISSDLKFGFFKDEKVLSGTILIIHGKYTEDINLESSFFQALYRRVPLRTVTTKKSRLFDNMKWQVSVTTMNPFVIENNILRSQITAALNLTGTFLQPGLTGRMESLEGGKLIFGRNTFFIEQATVDFLNPRRIEPDLNVTAITRAGEVDIRLTLEGTPDELSARLTSDPPLNEPNIISILTTGKTLETASSSLLTTVGTEALTYLDSALTGKVESSLEKSLGLESVRIDAGLISSIENPGARITFQQHLSQDLELIFSQNLQAARNRLWVLEYNPLPSVNIQGIKQDNNEMNISFRHEVRFGLEQMERRLVTHEKPVIDQLFIEGSPRFSDQKIKNRLNLRAGSRFDYFKFFDGLDRLRELYFKRRFLNPSITAARTEENGRMHITLRIDSGPKVDLEFFGAPVPLSLKKSSSRLWMNTSFDKMAIESIKEHLRHYFLSQKYLQVSVQHVESFGKDGERRIRFFISRGIKYKEPEFFFKGSRFIPDRKLEEIVRRGPGFHLLFMDPRTVIRKMRDFYAQNGFIRAEFGDPQIVFFPQEGTVTVTFPIAEGPRYRIGRISVEGNLFFDSTALEEKMGIRENDFFNQVAVEKAVFSIEEAYVRKGFNQVKLDWLVDVNEADEIVNLSFEIQENQQGTVGEIRIKGNSITSKKIIGRELGLEIGNPVDFRLINQARKRLYDLGIFKRVQIGAVPLESSQLTHPYRIEVEVVELQPYRLRYGLQYDTETSLGLSAELVNRNLFKRSMLVGTSFRLNREERDFKGFYRSPYFLSKKISTEFFIFFNSSDKPSFTLDRSGLTVQQQTKLDQFSILSYSYSYERVRTFSNDLSTGLDVFDSVHHEGMVNLSIAYDTRDNFSNASRGLFLTQNVGYADGWLGSDVRFVRYFGELYAYKKISDSFVYAFSFRLGFAKGLGQELALSQRFFAGGGTTIRGFKKNEVGSRDPSSGLAQGGDAVFIMNHELRFPFAKKWSGAVFLDMGNVYSRLNDFNPFDLREAAGFGIRFHTRFFLVRFDWGFKLDRLPGESLSRIFFSLGQAF
ncbi:MAG: translocation/assembly module TamB domain-containing protein [Candidatus Aminicenantes bacterium]